MPRKYLSALAASGLLLAATQGLAADEPARPTFDADGVTHVPAFALPPPELASPQARELMKMRASMQGMLPTQEADIGKSRAALAEKLAPQVAGMLQQHPVDVSEESIAGVPVRVVTPKDRPARPDRALINLHGGAFNTCWESCSLLESAPIADVGGYRVISVNYRMAPEAKHPAGVEDVEKVYRELLKQYEASQIGVYGCSAGGALTAQTASWLNTRGLPQPGAIGIFGAGAVRMNSGDSAYLAAYIDGSFPSPSAVKAMNLDMTRGYFDGADMADPIISPALHPEVMAAFPPTLLITGTRAMDLSPAIVTNSALLEAGGESTLVVGEGMGHCYLYMAQLPESQGAYKIITGFFERHLR